MHDLSGGVFHDVLSLYDQGSQEAGDQRKGWGVNVHHLLEWTHDEAERASGANEAWAKCHEEMKRMVDADNIETTVVLESVPEPSDAERSIWPDATKNYVEMLESLVDGLIVNKGISP